MQNISRYGSNCTLCSYADFASLPAYLSAIVPSLYSRLFKYRERESRSPKEDFLSEALCSFIDSFDRSEKIELIRALFIPRSLDEKWNVLVERTSRFSLDTQHWIDASSRLDITIWADDFPAIVIENKISAPTEETQLTRYGNWLKESRCNGWPGVLCFLTHTTIPPDGFANSVQQAGEVQSIVLKWAQVASVLRDLKARLDSTRYESKIGSELLLFLMEEGMTSEFAEFEDFCAAFVYIRASAKIDHSFSTIYRHIKSYGGYFTGDFQDDCTVWHDPELNFVWGWKFLKNTSMKELYFGYGIALKPSNYLKGSNVPTVDSVFLCLGSDKEKESRQIAHGASELGMQFAVGERAGGLWKFRPLSEFMIVPEKFPALMIEWIDEARPKIEGFLKKVKS